MHICMYVYTYVCIYSCVCVCRERERKRWEEGGEAENLLMDKVK
jgi:hypothetical protein